MASLRPCAKGSMLGSTPALSLCQHQSAHRHRLPSVRSSSGPSDAASHQPGSVGPSLIQTATMPAGTQASEVHVVSPSPCHATITSTALPANVPPALEPGDEYETVFETETETEEAAGAHAAHAARHQRQADPGAPALSACQLNGPGAGPKRVASFTMANTTISPALQSTVGGWVLAFSLLLAARVSRETADEERLDLRALQARQAVSRVQGEELRALRRAFLEGERERKEAEAAQRLAEAKRRAQAEEEERIVRESAYRTKASAETARVWAEQQAARQEFLAAESRMAGELEVRTKREVALMEEAAARKRVAEEKARREAEVLRAKQSQAAEKRAAELAAKAAEVEAERETRRAALRAAQTRFSITLQCVLTVQQAPLGTLTTECTQPGWRRGPQLARLLISLDARVAGAQQRPPRATSPVSNEGSGGSSTGGRTGVAKSALSSLNSAAWQRMGLPSGGAAVALEWPVGKRSTGSARVAYESASAVMEAPAPISVSIASPLLDSLYAEVVAGPADTEAGAGGPGAGSQVLARHLQRMDILEMSHWRRVSAACLEACTQQAVAQVAPLADKQPLDQPYQVVLLRAALPASHPSSVGARMATAVVALQSEKLEEVVQLVASMLEDEQEWQAAACQGLGSRGPALLPGTTPPVPLPPLTLRALVYAHLLERVALADETENCTGGHADSSTQGLGSGTHGEGASSPSEGRRSNPGTGTSSGSSTQLQSSSCIQGQGSSGMQGQSSGGSVGDDSGSGVQPGEGEGGSMLAAVPIAGVAGGVLQQQVVQLATYQLGLAARELGPDDLGPTARCVGAALGAAHPVSKAIAFLAEKNMGTGTRLRLEARKQQDLEVVSALLKAQDPRTLSRLNSSDPSSRQTTPVPERLWATRNVASSIVRFGDPTQAGEALAMLQEACELAAQHYGAQHPSCLGVLLDAYDAFKAVQSRSGIQEGAADLILEEKLGNVTIAMLDIVEGLGQRFMAAQDLLSVVVLYEAAVKELGPVTPASPLGLSVLQRTASQMLYQLSPQEARVAMARRSPGSPPVLRQLAKELNEDLRVYSKQTRKTRLDQWRGSGPLTPL